MNRAKQWISTKKTTENLSHPVDSPEQPLSLHQNITTLPLCRFIDCIVDGNLYALVMHGTVTDVKELQKAWNSILQQYSEAIGTSEFKLYISLYKEVSLLNIDYNSISNLVEALRSIQSFIILNNYEVSTHIFDVQKKLCDELNILLGTNFKFKPEDDAFFQEALNKCIRRSKSLKIKLDLKLIAFAAIEKKNKGSDVKMDRAYFDSILITISDHAKYEITETITVSKYCERIKRFTQYCDTLKNSKHG